MLFVNLLLVVADIALVVVEPTIISITMSLRDHILIADQVCLGTGSLAIVVFINLAVMGFCMFDSHICAQTS